MFRASTSTVTLTVTATMTVMIIITNTITIAITVMYCGMKVMSCVWRFLRLFGLPFGDLRCETLSMSPYVAV